MAFDALANIYKRKVDDDEKRAEWGTAAGNNVAATGTGDAFTPMGANASAGTAGAPVSAGFVNWGTRYGANKEKAGKQAQGIHDKVTNQAEGARGRVQAGQSRFAGLMGAGTPTGPRTGPHGTRVEAAQSTPTWDTSGTRESQLNNLNNTMASEQAKIAAAKEAARVKAAAPRASKYASLMGQYGGGRLVDSLGPQHAMGEAKADSEAALNQQLFAENEKPQSGEDFYFSVTPEQAAAKAQQGYTGPKDLKEAMGEAEYTATQEDLRKAEEAAKLTAQQGGLAAQMDYTGNVDDSGMASLDEAMARTAGGDAWRALAKRYGGLSKELAAANTNAFADAGRAYTEAQGSAGEWSKILSDYEAEQARLAAEKAKPKGIQALAGAREGSTGGDVGLGAPSTGATPFDSMMTSIAGGDLIGWLAGQGVSQAMYVEAYDYITEEDKRELERRWNEYGMTGTGSAATVLAEIIRRAYARAQAAKGKK